MNLAKIIEDHQDDRPALIDGDRTAEATNGTAPDAVMTYGELRERVAALRAVLSARGIGPDDRVALLAGIEADFAIGALAALGLGAAVAPISIGSPIRELERKLAAVDPAVLLVGGEGRWAFDSAERLDPPLISIDESPGGTPDAPIVDRSEDDLAFLMLTSGVSNDPKVAMLSHGNLRWVQETLAADTGIAVTTDDILLCALPLAHIFGLNAVVLPGLRVGAAIVLHRRFDARATLDSIARHGVTLVGGAPPMWQRWSELDAPADAMATVRHAASGAASLPNEVFTAFRDRFGLEIREAYGLTETSPTVTSSSSGPVRAGSVGRAVPGLELVLAEPDGTPVDVGDSGEIVIRSPGVFKGYLDAPELTSAVLTDDGWFWTGDVGVLDDDGNLYIIDRIKDVVIVSGFNVYPSEVESVLMEHPAVRGAVAVGTPDGLTGEAVVAHVAGTVDTGELDRFVRERLSHYKCPTEYHFVDELPVAPTGKLIRRELRR